MDFPVSHEEISDPASPAKHALISVLSSPQTCEENRMQVHKGEYRVGYVLSLNILEGATREELMRLLLTRGIEIEVASIQGDTVRLIVRAPGKMLIVEELVAPP